MLRATLVYSFIGLYVLVIAPPAMLWTILSRDTTLIYSLGRLCIRIAGWMSGVKLEISGTDKIRPGCNYVLLSNHQGNFDGPILLHVIPRDFRALVKSEMMRIPVLSLVMRQVKFVPIDRKDPERARQSIDRGAELLREGHSFVAFPEGTRSRDGRLREFKKGVFIMAIKAGTPIVPITISGSRELQPPGTYGIRPGTVRVIFHDPIVTDRADLEDRYDLMNRTRAAIASGLPDTGRDASDEAASTLTAENSASSP